MKNLIEHKASRKLAADHVVKAVLLDVGSPPPSEPDKQPIVLCLPPGDIKMGCNIIGKHLHIDPAEKGKSIWITAKKDGALYVSYFPEDGKHFLTIRDGVRFDFRPLDPKVKMHNPKDRLPYLAAHYRACYDEAFRTMEGAKALGGGGIDLVSIATALWLETKAGVTVPTSEPIKQPEAEAPAPEPAPAPGKPPEELPEVKEVHIQAALAEYSKMEYPDICEAAARAMKYEGKNPVGIAKKEALIMLIDKITNEKDPKAWPDVYDEIWQGSTDSVKEALDNAIARAFEMKPEITQSLAHKAACINYLEIINNEKI